MPTEKSPGAAEDGASSIPARPEAEAATPLGITDKPQTGIPSEPSTPSGHKPKSKRRLMMGAAAVLGLVILAVFGIPWIKLMLTTVSTDDAYVNGHVMFVAARVPGQVAKVLVDDNYRVNKGDLLVELDREPYEVDVAIKKAAVDTAKADLVAAKANVRGVEARARSQRWNLQHTIEDVENQIALLHSKVAGLDKAKASVKLAEVEFERAKQLVPKGYATHEEYDRRERTLSVSRAEVVQASTIYTKFEFLWACRRSLRMAET
jgi:membrane fusion protein, multidrug efflux system